MALTCKTTCLQSELGGPDPLWDALQEIGRLREALEIIASIRPCPDNLLGNADIARIALSRETKPQR